MKIKLSVQYFPPYHQYYVSANSHIDDYLRGGKIQRLHPDYFPTFEEAKAAIDKYMEYHDDCLR
jgi:hypothetical protein